MYFLATYRGVIFKILGVYKSSSYLSLIKGLKNINLKKATKYFKKRLLIDNLLIDKWYGTRFL